MRHVVFIGGTWAGHRDPDNIQWWDYVRMNTFSDVFCKVYDLEGYAFEWSGDLKASRWRWNKPWKKAALGLIECMDYACMETPPVVVAHSHGGNVALEAISRGLEVDHLITLATPPRAGVPQPILPSGLIDKWTNIVGTCDWVVRAGMLMDGRISTKTTHKAANNIVLPGESHTSVHEVDTWTKHDLWAKVDV